MRSGLTAVRCRAALRNYASAVFFRGNMPAIMAIYCGTMTLAYTPFMATTVGENGVKSLFIGPSGFTTLWWMAVCAITSTYMFHYWRQVRCSLAPAIPGLVAAEHAAISVVSVPLLPLLAGPMLWLGAPVFGALAATAVGMVVGGVMGTTQPPTGQSKTAGWVRTVLLMPFMFLGLVPNSLGSLVFAPLSVTLPFLLAAAAVILISLRYVPALATATIERAEQGFDRAAAQMAQRPVKPGWARLLAVLSWRPGFLPFNPLATSSFRFGSLSVLLGALASTGLALLLLPLGPALLGDLSYHENFQIHAPPAVSMLIYGGLSLQSRWLLNRGNWPLLFVAGRYGSRDHFAKAMFRAHLINVLEAQAMATAVAVGYAVALGLVPVIQAVPAALVVLATAFGATYATAIPLLWREFGGKGFTIAFQTIAGLIVMFTLMMGVFRSGLTLPAIGIAIALLLFGIAMAIIAPKHLAAMDWPFEADEPGL